MLAQNTANNNLIVATKTIKYWQWMMALTISLTPFYLDHLWYTWSDYGWWIEHTIWATLIFYLCVFSLIDIKTKLTSPHWAMIIAVFGIIANILFYKYSYGKSISAKALNEFLVAYVLFDGIIYVAAIVIFLWLMTLSYNHILRKRKVIAQDEHSFGWGDIIVIMAIGTSIGYKYTILTILFASTQALLFTSWLKYKNKEQFIPFLPFLTTSVIGIAIYHFIAM